MNLTDPAPSTVSIDAVLYPQQKKDRTIIQKLEVIEKALFLIAKVR